MKKYTKVLSSRELTKAIINAKKEVSFVVFINYQFYLFSFSRHGHHLKRISIQIVKEYNVQFLH